MGLGGYRVVASLAVSDMDEARAFYEGKLGLIVGTDSGDNVAYRCGEGTSIHIYLSPDSAGKSTATLVGWYVDDAERVVDELVTTGVSFDWSEQVEALQMPVVIVVGDADSVPPTHAVEFFGLLGGGKRDAGWYGSGMPASRLSVLPGTTHYDIFHSPALASIVAPFLDAPVAGAG